MKFLILGIVIIINLIIIIRTINFKSRKYAVEQINDINVDTKRAIDNLSGAIKIKTISNSDYNKTNWDEFNKLHKFLEENYPLVHSTLEKKEINKYSLIYKWSGKNSNKKPILLTAHMDVVPIEMGTEKDWKCKPFSGEIKDEYVWGRGTLDIKIQIIGIMEAIEKLLNEKYIPHQDIYLAFGHDEEVGGTEGAVEIAKFFKSKGIEFQCVLDEGGCVTEGSLKNVSSPIAVIGIAEKGYANIKLTDEANGGHASMPPKSTSVGAISEAVVKLEKHQLKTKITEPVKNMLYFVGPEMKLMNRMVISNLWIFAPLFKKFFSSTNSGNALLRTTTAATMVQGSSEPNILPQKSSAVFNFRVIPGETCNDLLEHIKKTINNPKITIEGLRLDEPSKVSSVTSKGFKVIEKTIYQIFTDSVVSPYLVLAGTDARKYECVCDNIYRFSPYQIKDEDLSKMHGTNECISFDNIEKCIKFYIQLIKNFQY